jgi:hypothetical protein
VETLQALGNLVVGVGRRWCDRGVSHRRKILLDAWLRAVRR